jgi:undecaprenyl diphosphate synthase
MSIQAEQSATVAGPEGPARRVPRHVAIIMDGNGRWAAERGLPRSEGHRRGVEAVRRTVSAAIDCGVGHLTLFSFSSENWSRPRDEVEFLFGLLRLFIRRDLANLHRNGVRIRVIGERAGLPDDILALILEAERLTEGNRRLELVVAFNYGSRDEITRAMRKIAAKVQAGTLDPAAIDEATIAAHLDTAAIPDPDLLIRTSGEVRLSNFLLWQAAYAEMLFLRIYWPDFGSEALNAAIEEFSSRTRRYGGLAAKGGG